MTDEANSVADAAMPNAIPELGYRPTMPTILRRAEALFGAEEALVTKERRTTFRELNARSAVLAKQLLLSGVGKGSRVGIFFPSGHDWLVSFAAAARLGALAVCIPSTSSPAEFVRMLRIGDVATLLTSKVMLGRDQEAFIESAVPGLASSAGPLALPDVPYLRRILLAGSAGRSWAGSGWFDGALSESSSPGPNLELVESLVEPADEMVVIFTSGSSAEPKAVVHTQGSVVRKTGAFRRLVPAGGRIFCGQQFFWVGGLLVLGTALQNGATVVCQERFDPAGALDLMERERVTNTIAWPVTKRALASHPSFSHRLFPAKSEIASQVDPELRHGSLGMTETMGPHTGGPRSGAPSEEQKVPLPERLRGSWGAAIEGFEHRIVDPQTGIGVDEGCEGEVWVRGYSLMSGFYKKEQWQAFTPDGWYRTGDRGYFKDGYLFFTGRLHDVIKSHGANVSPREVELALERCEGVGTAFVFGIPDSERGEKVAAAIVRSDVNLTSADISSRVREDISGFKVPRFFLLLDQTDVPTLSSGKADRRRIEELVIEASRSGAGAQ